MDAPNRHRWHPSASPLAPAWPIVPPLLQDEIISSWLVRSALVLGCDPTTLTNELWPGKRPWCRDLDRTLNNEELTLLAMSSGLAACQLEESTLGPIYSALSGAQGFPKAIAPWILCLGNRSRRRCGGLQYCPKCFSDSVPYYPIESRLAWHTACTIHHTTLVDRCECCDAPLCPHLIMPPEIDLARCHRCKFELKLASSEASVCDALVFQNAADGLFAGKPQYYGHDVLSISDWFHLSKWMLGALRSAARARSSGTKRFFNCLGINLDDFTAPATGLPFEYLTPKERAYLLSSVWLILQAGPERFVEAAAHNSAAPSLLLSPWEESPGPLADLETALRSRQPVEKERHQDDAPRSHKNVMMRWHRLLRKLQR